MSARISRAGLCIRGIVAKLRWNKRRDPRAFEEACENARMAREAGLGGSNDDPSLGGIRMPKGAANDRS